MGTLKPDSSKGNFLLKYSFKSGFQQPNQTGQASPAIWTETLTGTSSSVPLKTVK